MVSFYKHIFVQHLNGGSPYLKNCVCDHIMVLQDFTTGTTNPIDWSFWFLMNRRVIGKKKSGSIKDFLDRSVDLRIKENFQKIHMIWSSGNFKLSFRSFSSQSTIIKLLFSRTWLARLTFWPSIVRVQRSLDSNANQSCERNRYRKRVLRSISLNIAQTCNFQIRAGDLKIPNREFSFS